MKLIHIGDLHLGKTLCDFDLYDDQKYMLGKIVELAIKEKVDGLLVAGDVYDKSVPSEAAISLFDNFLKELSDNQIKTFIISGNHDSDERMNYGSILFQNSDIYISSKIKEKLFKYTYDNGVNIYLMPFVKASIIRHLYQDESIKTYDDAIKAIINHSDINEDEINILVAHQFVIGNKETIFDGSEAISSINVGTIESVNASCFDKFDYVALGHIHRPQKITRDTIRYSGSMLKYSLSEVNSDKSLCLIEINTKDDIKVKNINIKTLRDVVHIEDNLNNILSDKYNEYLNDYLYITLNDEVMLEDVMSIIQRKFPFTLKVNYHNSYTKDVDEDIFNINEDKSYIELISDFYKSIYGKEINDEEMAICKDIAKEVGIINEAD